MKYISKLTKKQKEMMPVWAKKWIDIGLQVGETDWETFDKYMSVCYKKAGLKYPKRVVRVSSPLVGALAASMAGKRLNSGAVRDAVRDAVDGAVRDAVDGAVDDAVGVAVRDAVGDAVDVAVDDAVRDAVRDAVDGAVGGAKLNWHYWLGGQFWVGYWYYYGPSSISFFTEVCGLKLSKDIQERAEAYQKVCQSVNYIWPNKDFVMVCARPKYIGRDNMGQLHSDERMAIEYPDCWGLYFLHGVRFEKDLWEKIVNRKLSFKEVSEIKDIDQRTQAMAFCPPREFLEKEGKLLDKSERGNELWLVPQSAGLFRIDAYFLLYKDISTSREYMSGIKPEIGAEKNADSAMAWKFGLKKFEYDNLKVES